MNKSIFSNFKELLATNHLELLRQSCLKEHPASLAEHIAGLQLNDAWRILRLLPEAHQAEIICHMDGDMQQTLLLAIERKEAARIISEMSSDDRADLFQKFNDEQKNSFYPIMAMAERQDMEKMMAIHGDHQPHAYFKTSSWVHFKSRAYWIVALAAIGLVSGVIIQSFEESLTSLIILALYMPMVADTGGNTGSQAATVVVRALALGEIVPRDALKVLYKEIKISFLLALVLGGLSFCKVIFLSHGADIPQGFSLDKIGATIALALGLQVVTATLVGAMLPLIAARLKQDPAIVASPAITTVVDITGLLIYFGMAKMLLGL